MSDKLKSALREARLEVKFYKEKFEASLKENHELEKEMFKLKRELQEAKAKIRASRIALTTGQVLAGGDGDGDGDGDKDDTLTKDDGDDGSYSGSAKKVDRRKGTTWEIRYKELIQFKQETGHCNVTKSCGGKYKKLGPWVSKQRHYYKLFTEGKRPCFGMTQERADLLNAIDFSWESANRFGFHGSANQSWDKRYEQLKEFYDREGHSNVPQKHPLLGTWVKDQRKHYRIYQEGNPNVYTSMTPEKISKLNELNFIWNAMPSPTSRGGRGGGDDDDDDDEDENDDNEDEEEGQN